MVGMIFGLEFSPFIKVGHKKNIAELAGDC